MDIVTKITEIKYRFDEAFFEKHKKIVNAMLNSKIPKSGKLFLFFMTITNDLSLSISHLIERGDYYGIKVLFRTQIENYLRFMYIWMRCCKEKNDNCANEFYDILAFKEIKDELNTMKRRCNDDSNKTNIYDAFRDIKPEYSHLTNRDIERKTSQFAYKNLATFIHDNISKDKQGDSIVLMLMSMYSELSTFVHGGPSAHNEMIANSLRPDALKEQSELGDILIHSTLLAIQVNLYTFMAFTGISEDEDIIQLFNQLSIEAKTTLYELIQLLPDEN